MAILPVCTEAVHFSSSTLNFGHGQAIQQQLGCISIGMLSLSCAMPHTILPCGHIYISCFYVIRLLPVLVISEGTSAMADLNQTEAEKDI
jgi:hypothetical protein